MYGSFNNLVQGEYGKYILKEVDYLNESQLPQ